MARSSRFPRWRAIRLAREWCWRESNLTLKGRPRACPRRDRSGPLWSPTKAAPYRSDANARAYLRSMQHRRPHRPRIHRTVTETDNLLITALTHNPQPLHLDAEYAGSTEFGRIVVNGIFTFGLMVGLSVGDTTLGTLVANLGYDAVVMPHPVFIGDTLRAETWVVEKRESKSRPRQESSFSNTRCSISATRSSASAGGRP